MDSWMRARAAWMVANETLVDAGAVDGTEDKGNAPWGLAGALAGGSMKNHQPHARVVAWVVLNG